MSEGGDVPVRLDKFRALMRDAGVEYVVEDAVRVYLKESPSRIVQMRAALDAGDSAKLEAVAHALKSASLNIWAVGLAEHLEAIEAGAAAGDVSVVGRPASAAFAEFERVVAYLERTMDLRDE